TGTGTPARPSGGTAVSSAAGRSGRTGRSSSASSRTSGRTASGPSKPRPPVSHRGSATSASRPASCPRSSARSRPERRRLSLPEKDLLRDHETLDLRRALVDLEQLRVAHELLDRVLLDVAVSAEDLHGVGCDLHRRVGG